MSLLAAIVAGTVSIVLGAGRAVPLISWDALAVVFCSWVWAVIWRMDAEATAKHAHLESPRPSWGDLVLVGAAMASLFAVAVVLFGAGHAKGDAEYFQAGLAVASVFVSWTLVHTVYTLKYARLYYSAPGGGIDFNDPDPPQYSDFAYLAFTVGMTFQVSDTAIASKRIRRTTLQHAWLSFPLGAVIIATSINLVSGLAK